MKGEFDIYGVFIPTLALWMLVAYGLSAAIRRALEAFGLYRFVWRRPLFDLALYTVVLASIANRFSP